MYRKKVWSLQTIGVLRLGCVSKACRSIAVPPKRIQDAPEGASDLPDSQETPVAPKAQEGPRRITGPKDNLHIFGDRLHEHRNVPEVGHRLRIPQTPPTCPAHLR